MPPAFEDNLSSCRSSPLHWKPVPVPAPVFDGFYPDLSAGEEINSWEQCMRILNNSRNGNSRFSCLEVMDDDLYVAASIQPSSRSASMRSFSSSRNFQRTSSAYPVFGSTGSERQVRRPSTAMHRYHVQSPEREAVPQNQSQVRHANDEEVAEVKVEELAVTIRNNSTRDGGVMKSARMGSSLSRVTWNSPTLQSEYSDFPTNRDFESIDERQQQHSGSILKRIFGQLGAKNRLSRSSSTISSILSHSRGPTSDCRSKDGGCFGGKAWMKRRKSPRLSSVDLGGDADPRVSSTNLTNDGISSACGDEEESVFGRNMMRWLQYQQWLAMATRAQNNLTELATMLQYAVKSLDDMKAMDEVAQEMHQKRTRCYYAS